MKYQGSCIRLLLSSLTNAAFFQVCFFVSCPPSFPVRGLKVATIQLTGFFPYAFFFFCLLPANVFQAFRVQTSGKRHNDFNLNTGIRSLRYQNFAASYSRYTRKMCQKPCKNTFRSFSHVRFVDKKQHVWFQKAFFYFHFSIPRSNLQSFLKNK